MRLTREQRKQKLSERGQRAAYARWDAYHASIPRPDYGERPANMYRLTFENLMTGKTEILTFHPGNRRNNYTIDVNGSLWRVCGMVDALRRVEKSCYRMVRYA